MDLATFRHLKATERDTFILKSGLLFGGILSTITLAIVPIFKPRNVELISSGVATFIVLFFACFLLHKRIPHLKLFVTILEVALCGLFATNVHLNVVGNATLEFIISSTCAYTGICFVMILFSPLRLHWMALFAAGLIVIGQIALAPHPAAWRWVFVSTPVLLSIVLFCWASRGQVQNMADLEFKAMGLRQEREAQLLAEKRALEMSLEVAASVQGMHLPDGEVREIGAYRVASFYKPATDVGGDWWGLERDGASARIFLADVTGHGAAAAMLTSTIAGAMAGQAWLEGLAKSKDVPGRLAALDKVLESVKTIPCSATFLAVDLSPESCVAWSAGSTPAMHVNTRGEVKGIAAGSSVLGTCSFRLGSKSFQMEPGERLLLFTDGLSELASPSGKALGYRAMREALTASRADSLAEVKSRFETMIRMHSGGREPDDDITFVLVERIGS